jgi:hypothetical protein
MREAKDPGDAMCIDKVVEEHPAGHQPSLHPRADGSYTCELSVRGMM